MGIFSFFRSRQKGTANTAKERLQVLIAHQHADSAGPDYLPMLKKDILNVIKKYVDIGEEQVVVQLDSQDDCDVLELNITLPEDAKGSTQKASDRKLSITTAQTKTKAASSSSNTDADDALPEPAPEKTEASKSKNTRARGPSARSKKKAQSAASAKVKSKKNRESLSD